MYEESSGFFICQFGVSGLFVGYFINCVRDVVYGELCRWVVVEPIDLSLILWFRYSVHSIYGLPSS